jgi:hypothetical protein
MLSNQSSIYIGSDPAHVLVNPCIPGMQPKAQLMPPGHADVEADEKYS